MLRIMKTMMMRSTLFVLATAAFMSGHAQAQATGAVPLTNVNFDMWCQEQEHLPPDRCDKRLPEDDAKFQAYVAKIQGYEVPYLQDRQEKADMNRVIFHNDPIDHSNKPGAPGNQAPPDSPPSN
jgi:hypothetical protein